MLVSVLWILAILTVMALGFGRRSMMERKVAWYALDHAQALQMARGAAERAIAEIGNKGLIDRAEKKDGYTGPDQRWAKPMNLLKDEEFFTATGSPEFADDVCGYRIFDCSARISINWASEDLLRDLDGLSATAVRKILARRRGGDDGHEVRTFASIDEIRALPGIDDKDWYGREPGAGLRDILSVWGGLINVNTASEAVLRALPRVQDSLIDRIVGYRAGSDGKLGTKDDQSFETMDDLSEKLEVSADKLSELRRFCGADSNLFRIEAVASRRRGKVVARVTAIVRSGGSRSVLQWSEDVVRT